MDAFLTFYGHAVPINPLILIEPQGDFPGRVLNKTRIFIGFLGDKLFIRTLKQRKDRRRSRSLGHFHQFFDPYRFRATDRNLGTGPLIVRTIFADFLGAGAKGVDGDIDAHIQMEGLPFSAW